MESSKVKVSEGLQQVYDSYYDDGLETWREIGARQKVENILRVAEGKKFGEVLEIGSGSGIILQKLSEAGFAERLYSLEISESSVEQLRKKQIPNLQDAQLFDGYQIPYGDKTFDLVVLSHVLEHVEFPRKLLREIKRVAQAVIIEVPRDYKPNADARWQSLVDYGHINLYTPTLLRFLLKQEGFLIRNEHQSLSSKELVMFQANQKKVGMAKLKAKLFLFVRNMLFPLVPAWRKETMINAFTVYCEIE